MGSVAAKIQGNIDIRATHVDDIQVAIKAKLEEKI